MSDSYKQFKIFWIEKQISWLKMRTEYLFSSAEDHDDMIHLVEMYKEMVKMKRELKLFKGQG